MIFGTQKAERFKPSAAEEVSLAELEGVEALKELEDFFAMEDSEREDLDDTIESYPLPFDDERYDPRHIKQF